MNQQILCSINFKACQNDVETQINFSFIRAFLSAPSQTLIFTVQWLLTSLTKLMIQLAMLCHFKCNKKGIASFFMEIAVNLVAPIRVKF